MKKLLLILITVLISVISSVYLFVDKMAVMNGKIEIINDSIHIRNIILIDTLASHNDCIELNDCLNNAYVKPYLQASFINKYYTINLTKDQWVQITEFDAFIGHDLSMSNNAVIIDEISSRGDYNINLSFVAEAGATGTKDKQLQLAISINDTIRIEGMSVFSVSKDNEALFTSVPSSAKYRLKVGDVIKAWLMNATDDADYVIINSRINFDKL